jgi:hypothetical protein
MVIFNYKNQKDLYSRDLNLWIMETIDLLQKGNFDGVDIDNLIQELVAMGGRDKREVTNRLTTIIEHLLKLIYWDGERVNNQRVWTSTIKTQRIKLLKVLQQSPSLNNYLKDNYPECLLDAMDIFQTKTAIIVHTEDIDFNLDLILDKNWLPANTETTS